MVLIAGSKGERDYGAVSVFCVTSDPDTAQGLATLLGNSRYRISVEWIGADADALDALHLRVAKRQQTPAIVLLDFASHGRAVWSLVSRSHALMKESRVEWLIANCEGIIPQVAGFPWHLVTMLAGSASRQ